MVVRFVGPPAAPAHAASAAATTTAARPQGAVSYSTGYPNAQPRPTPTSHRPTQPAVAGLQPATKDYVAPVAPSIRSGTLPSGASPIVTQYVPNRSIKSIGALKSTGTTAKPASGSDSKSSRVSEPTPTLPNEISSEGYHLQLQSLQKLCKFKDIPIDAAVEKAKKAYEGNSGLPLPRKLFCALCRELMTEYNVQPPEKEEEFLGMLCAFFDIDQDGTIDFMEFFCGFLSMHMTKVADNMTLLENIQATARHDQMFELGMNDMVNFLRTFCQAFPRHDVNGVRALTRFLKYTHDAIDAPEPPKVQVVEVIKEVHVPVIVEVPMTSSVGHIAQPVAPPNPISFGQPACPVPFAAAPTPNPISFGQPTPPPTQQPVVVPTAPAAPPSGTALPGQDLVQFSVFAPPEIKAGASFDLSFAAFVEACREAVRQEEQRHGNAEMGTTADALPIRAHQEVRVSLQLPSYFTVDRASAGCVDDPSGQGLPTKSFVWEGNGKTTVLFEVLCHAEASPILHSCVAMISVNNGESTACLQFGLNVSTGEVLVKESRGLPVQMHTRKKLVVMSTPEFGSAQPDGSGPYDFNVMQNLQSLQCRRSDGSLNFLLAFDRKGSTTGHEADMKLGEWWKGDDATIKDTHWFYGYSTRVKACAFVECQEFDGVLEVLCIHGGPITQVEQKEMPRIIRDAKYDAQLSGVRCAIDIKYIHFYQLKEHIESGCTISSCR